MRRSLKHLTIGGRGAKSEGPSSSSPSWKTTDVATSLKNGEEIVEMLEMQNDDDDKDRKKASTWSERYSTWRRSLRRNASQPPPPPPPDDAVVPKTCCSFSR